MTKSNDKKVPALRFKGFTDDWEQRKLEKMVNFFSGLTYHPHDVRNNGCFVIRSSNIQNNQIVSADDVFVNRSIVNVPNVEQGDIIVVVRNGSRKLIGKHARVLSKMSNTVIGAFMTGLRSDDNGYINALLDSDQFQKEIYKNLGSTINQITTGEFKKMNFMVAKESENKKIGKFFKLVDNLISLQQRKLEGFMTIKAELLRSIFPNKVGKRDINFSDQMWKIQIMNDIFKEKNIKNEHGTLLSVSISKGIYPFSENERKNNSSNNKSNYKEVKYNDIAYNSMRMWQGALGVSEYDGIVSPAYTVITAKKQENPLFYYYYFKNKRMLFNFRQHSQGLTSDTWNLKFPLFKKIVIQTPISKKEEQIIANLFKTLDQNIVSTKMKIKKFNYIKQFFLQNMFI